MSDDMTPAKVQEMILTRPFHQWLGLTVTAVGDETIELKAADGVHHLRFRPTGELLGHARRLPATVDVPVR